MYTIILASHKNLAKGMKETVEYILGPAPFIKVMTAYTDDNYDIEKIRIFFSMELIKSLSSLIYLVVA